ncbi:Target of rapamycin complex subunit lst8 [Nymphon striatum]|nr:Target of rapamycin complex subunit lst8 [Nymphon striatum]
MVSDGTSEKVLLATGGYDHTIMFWQAHTGVCYRTLQHPDSQVNALEITNDKQLLAAAGFQHIRMYEINTGKPNPIMNYEGVSKNVTAVGFNDTTKWMFSAGEDGCARIWDLRARNSSCQRIFQAFAPINSAVLYPNQGELIIGDQSGMIHIWNIKNESSDQIMPERDASIQCVDVDPNGNYLAAINNKGVCYIWSMKYGEDDKLVELKATMKLEAHSKYGLKCKFSPDSSFLATTSADNSAKIWRMSDFSLVKELKNTNLQRWVWDIAFSSDSQYAITASSDAIVKLWHIDSGEVKREYSGHQKAVSCLAFRDG